MDLRYKGFRFRAFISLLMAIGFLSLAVSGVVLYMAPSCSIAASTGWTISGISKESWVSLHTGMAVIIIFAGIVHLFLLNWKSFVLYLKAAAYRKGKGGFRPSKEVITGVVLAAVLIAAAVGQLGPFGWIHETGERIKDRYRQEYRTGTGAQQQGYELRQDGTSGRDRQNGQDTRGLGPEQGGRGLGRNR